MINVYALGFTVAIIILAGISAIVVYRLGHRDGEKSGYDRGVAVGQQNGYETARRQRPEYLFAPAEVPKLPQVIELRCLPAKARSSIADGTYQKVNP